MAVTDAPPPRAADHVGMATLPRPRRAWLRYILPVAALVVVVGGGGLAAFATDTTESYWDGLWWSISLITTVGWSGQPPTTLAGHLIAVVTMLCGFMLLAFVTASIASLLVREDEQPAEQAELRADERILEELRSLRAEVRALQEAEGKTEPTAPRSPR